LDLSSVDLSSFELRFATVERTADGKELRLKFQHSPKWPSVDLFPPAGTTWDLSAAGGFEMDLTNHSDQTVKTVAYITNAGDSHASIKRNGDQADLPPGKRSTIRVEFDPSQYPLDRSQLASIRIFVNKLTGPVEMTLHGIRAIPGEAPVPTAAKPVSDAASPGQGKSQGIPDLARNPGILDFRFASATPVDGGEAMQLDFDLSPKWPSVEFQAHPGTLWDLSEYSEVVISLTNLGESNERAIAYLANENDIHQRQQRSSAKTRLPGGATDELRIQLKDVPDFDPAAVHHLRIFTGMHQAPVRFKLNSVQAVRE